MPHQIPQPRGKKFYRFINRMNGVFNVTSGPIKAI